MTENVDKPPERKSFWQLSLGTIFVYTAVVASLLAIIKPTDMKTALICVTQFTVMVVGAHWLIWKFRQSR